MTEQRKKPTTPDLEAEFVRLFWQARKRQRQLGDAATAADRDYKRVIAFADDQGWAWAGALLEASRLNRTGANDEALRILAKSETSVPSRWHGLVHYLRGVALAAKGVHDEAIKAYRRALGDPKFDTPGYAWNNLGLALSATGEHDEAIKAYRKAIDDLKFDTTGDAWNNLGNALSVKGEHDEAIQAYRKALDDTNIDSPAMVWTNLAQTYVSAGKTKDAEDAFEKALASPDKQGGDHARARLGLQLLTAKINPTALSPDDRALVEKSVAGSSSDEIEDAVIAAIQAAGDTQYEKYINKSDSERDGTLSILRGWSSAVTLLEGSERRWRGGGYFLKWRGYGIVIDPGFDFLRNFHDAGYHGREIQAVVVSHNHPDHNSDLKDIDDLRYELFKRLAKPTKSDCLPYVLLWDQDTAGQRSSDSRSRNISTSR